MLKLAAPEGVTVTFVEGFTTTVDVGAGEPVLVLVRVRATLLHPVAGTVKLATGVAHVNTLIVCVETIVPSIFVTASEIVYIPFAEKVITGTLAVELEN